MFVYIVGVDHRIQWIPKSSSPQWAKEVDRFITYICSQCKEHNIEIVAEEFSEYLVNQNSAENSSARYAATKVGLEHLYCDPDPNERNQLEIEDSNAREQEWLNRLVASKKEKIIFICGNNHIDSFVG